MPGCNTPEENALALAIDVVKEACVRDYVFSLTDTSEFRFYVARNGFKGFANMTTEELVQAALDADLDEASSDVSDAINLIGRRRAP
jgi:hypothetical protein